MTVAVEKYDRVHKARKKAPLLEGDDLARMKEAVSKLEVLKEDLENRICDLSDDLENAREELRLERTLKSERITELARIYRRIEAGDTGEALRSLEAFLSWADSGWRVRA